MTDLLLRHATVIDPGGPHHDEEVDVLISKGRIAKVGKRLSRERGEELRMEGLHLSPGWVESQAHFRDPGEEYKQGITNGLDAAAAGGFTRVAVLPSTQPPTDSSSGVQYLLRSAQGHAVRALSIGALTKGLKGEQLAEHFDMKRTGAVAFSDDQQAVHNARLMLLALQYALNFNGRVIAFPQHPDLSSGLMHEGPMSVRLGMRGIPAIAETTQLARDLTLLEYTGSRMHVATVSTAEGVELIRQAKARKLRVTASVAAYNLLLDDGCLRGFDTHYKVMPPLRDQRHIEALRDGVKDGTLDTITSDHRPEDVEHKRVEFPQAAFGMIGLETAFAVSSTALKGRLSTRKLVERFCHGPRAALGLEVPHIAEGNEAEISLFTPDHEWSFAPSDIVSRSHNTPFIGHRFTGRALGIFAQGQLMLHPAFAAEMA